MQCWLFRRELEKLAGQPVFYLAECGVDLRHNFTTNAPLALTLDQVFTNIVSGQEENALTQLGKLKAQFPLSVLGTH